MRTQLSDLLHHVSDLTGGHIDTGRQTDDEVTGFLAFSWDGVVIGVLGKAS